MRYNTGNPLDSDDPKDLSDNSKNLDQYLNAEDRAWLDRFGRARVSAKGVELATPDAIAARDRAESAAAVAQLAANATPYATKAAMDAVVPTQDAWAVVLNDPDPKKNGYYIGRAGTWVWSELQPVKDVDVKALQDLISQADSAERAFDFADKFDQLIATLFADGTFATRALQLLGSDLPVEGGKLGLAVRDAFGFVPVRFDADKSWLYGMTIEPMPDGAFAIVDRNGFVLLYIGPGGGFGLRKPEVQQPIDLGAQVRTAVMHVMSYGQSLSRGNQAAPPVSTVQPYSNIMLKGGVKARVTDPEYDASAFVPLVESVVGSDGETPVSGALNGIVRRAVAAGSTADRWVFLGSACGQGAQTVQQLAQFGSNQRFEQMLQIVRDTKKLCDAQGKTYSVWAMHWYQGEDDYSAWSLDQWPYDYLQRWLTRLWQPFKREVVQITGQAFAPYLFTYQVAAHRRYNRDDMPIALAQWRASKAYDDVILAAPAYIFPAGADNLHLTAEGSWLMGEYVARANYQTMIHRSGKWRPLEPEAVDWQGQTIKVKFHVPSGQLVIDNALCAAYENAGFILRDGADAVIAGGITAVAVTGRDEITITTAVGIPLDAKLTYARGKPGDAAHSGPVTGARGNVRDTAGLYDRAISPLGNEFALHNACVMFEYSRAAGF